MTIDADRLANRLEEALGSAVQRDPVTLRAHAVDGLVPHIRCAPQDTSQLSAALRICGESGAAVIPWGGGTAMHWGNLPTHADVVVSLEHLNRLIEHDDAYITETVQAWMCMAPLHDIHYVRRPILAD